MTKGELIRLLEPFTDDIEILVANYNSVNATRHEISVGKFTMDKYCEYGIFVLIAPSIDGL